MKAMVEHRKLWLERAQARSGLPRSEVETVYNAVLVTLFAGARSKWPVTDPFERALDGLQNLSIREARPADLMTKRERTLEALDLTLELDEPRESAMGTEA